MDDPLWKELEKKIAALEKSQPDMCSWLSVHTRVEPDRVKRIIHEALTPSSKSKTLTIYKEIKPFRPKKKKNSALPKNPSWGEGT